MAIDVTYPTPIVPAPALPLPNSRRLTPKSLTSWPRPRQTPLGQDKQYSGGNIQEFKQDIT